MEFTQPRSLVTGQEQFQGGGEGESLAGTGSRGNGMNFGQ